MATETNKRLAQGVFSTTANTMIYTVPALTYTIVKAINICNKTNVNDVVTIKLAGTEIMYQHVILANDSITIPFIDQIIHAGEKIEGHSGNGSSLTYYISGKEVV